MGDRGSRGARQDDGIQNGLEEWESKTAQAESGGESENMEDASQE